MLLADDIATTTAAQSQILPSYLYRQYAQDASLQAMVGAWNSVAQGYLQWFHDTPLAVYTDQSIGGNLLDWVAAGIYGANRPVTSNVSDVLYGALGTQAFGASAMGVGSFVATGFSQPAIDDIFRRVLVWNQYRGDGTQMSIGWLKRRINRFLNGVPGQGAVYPPRLPISVTPRSGLMRGALGTSSFGGLPMAVLTGPYGADFTITLPDGPLAGILSSLLTSGQLTLPFEYSFAVKVVAVSQFGGLMSDGGFLVLTDNSVGYPTSIVGLSAGALWSNGGVISVYGTTTPSASAPPIYMGSITAAALLAIGGANLPTSLPSSPSQLWNNGGIVSIA